MKSIRRFLCQSIPQEGGKILLSKAEAKHAKSVLRLGRGDHVEAIDGRGGSVIASIQFTDLGTELKWEEKGRISGSLDFFPIHLEISVLKADCMELVIEKAVELGAQTLTPFISEHTVVQIKRKSPEFFRERWQRIADQSLKQCGRLTAMEISSPVEMETLLAKSLSTEACPRLFFDEAHKMDSILPRWLARQSGLTEIRLMIGPEGGWSDRDREFLDAGATVTGLGQLTLRAETAAIYGLSLMNSFFAAGKTIT